MVQFQDLQVLLEAHNRFELTQSIDGLEIDELEIVCCGAACKIDPLSGVIGV